MSTGERQNDQVTEWLQRSAAGDAAAQERLYEAVYGELKHVAAAALGGRARSHTLQPTALVNEAFLKLGHGRAYVDRVHFFAAAATAMRHVLVDHAKSRARAKRGGGWRRVSLAEGLIAGKAGEPGILDLAEALDSLEALAPRQARIVELRFFGGLTVEETAQVLGLGRATVEADWRVARAWLHRELSRT